MAMISAKTVVPCGTPSPKPCVSFLPLCLCVVTALFGTLGSFESAFQRKEWQLFLGFLYMDLILTTQNVE